MSKPILDVTVRTLDGRKAQLDAVLDTGSFYTIIREDSLPKGARYMSGRRRKMFGTARRGGKLSVAGTVHVEIRVEGRWIDGEAFVAPDLGSAMLIGAGMMQMWDISVRNRNGHTKVHVGRDMNDPHIQTVL